MPRHKTPTVSRWLAQHLRFHLHFTPTFCTWINLVDRWFTELTTRLLRRGPASLRPARSAPTSGHGIDAWTENLDPTSGPRPPIKSSTRSNATANELTGRDARDSPGISDRWHSGSSI